MTEKSTAFRRLIRTKRLLEDARAALDMLAHRLREGGPETSRAEILKRVTFAADMINQVVPRSILRDDN